MFTQIGSRPKNSVALGTGRIYDGVIIDCSETPVHHLPIWRQRLLSRAEAFQMRLNYLTLSFRENDGFEKAFLRDYADKSLRQVRISLGVAVAFYSIFSVLDALVAPDVKSALWIIRYAVFVPITSGILMCSFSSGYYRYMQTSLAVVIITAGLGIIGMVIIAPASVSDTYYAGLILVLIFGYTFLRARFVYAAFSGLMLVAFYEIAAIWLIHTPKPVLITNNFFIISANIIGMFACYSFERSTRWSFYLVQLLSDEHEKVNMAKKELETANEKLKQLSVTDGLTQIPNRRMFDRQLSGEWARLMRENAPMALIMCDVDYFKRYNDHYGHQMGDNSLRLVAQAIQSAINRPSDFAARYGGEEFCVILPNTNVNGAGKVAQSIQTRIAALKIPHQDSPIHHFVTMSFGIISIVPDKHRTPDDLVKLADRALYEAKKRGRNQMVFGE